MAGIIDLFGPLAAGPEKELLHHHLRLARDNLVFKVEGLPEPDRRRPMTPTGTNLIGVVKHMTWIESWYLCDAFGRPRPVLAWESDPDGQIFQWSDQYATPSQTTDELLATYAEAAAPADASIEALDLDTIGLHPRAGLPMSLRALLLIVLLDTTRHGGQSDIVRELVDGATGSRDQPSPFAGRTDEDYRERYLARVRGEIDDQAWWTYLQERGGG